jgi:hypothetical protein
MADFRKLKSNDSRGYDARLNLQKLDLNRSTDIALWGGAGAGTPPLRVGFSDPTIAQSIELAKFQDSGSNLRLFQITGLRPGTAKLEARDTSKNVWASMEIKVEEPSKSTVVDLEYDGQQLRWTDIGTFKATSGMPKGQSTDLQCATDLGPIPNGFYYLILKESVIPARDDGSGVCNLGPGWYLERIPRGEQAGECEAYWVNWGTNRIRLTPADKISSTRSCGYRSGFYLHDSTKGFSHGCIEVESTFFDSLRNVIRTKGHPERLSLRVNYVTGRPTNGGTKKPP